MPRKRMPAVIKERLGNPGKRPIQHGPTPPDGVPDPPSWFDEEARSEWTRISGVLRAMGVLSEAFRPIMVAHCVAWSEFVAALRDAQQNGRTMVTQTGYEAPRPCVAAMLKWHARLESTSARLGLTPSDISRLGARDKDEPRDVLDELWSQRNGSGAIVAHEPAG